MLFNCSLREPWKRAEMSVNEAMLTSSKSKMNNKVQPRARQNIGFAQGMERGIWVQAYTAGGVNLGKYLKCPFNNKP